MAVDIFRALLGNRVAADVFEDGSVRDKAMSLWQGLVDFRYKQTGGTARAKTGKVNPRHYFIRYSYIHLALYHDDVMKWKHFPRYWPFVWGIHRSPVNSPNKGQ